MTYPKSFLAAGSRNDEFREELRDWRGFQGRNSARLSLWTLVRDLLVRSHDQNWGDSNPTVTVPQNASQEVKDRAKERAKAIGKMPSYEDLLAEVGLDRSTSMGKLEQLMTGQTSHSSSRPVERDFVKFSQRVYAYRESLHDSLDELIATLKKQVTYDGETVDFRSDFESEEWLTTRVQGLNSALGSVGSTQPGREFLGEQLYKAYKRRATGSGPEPVFDPFEILEPTARELWGGPAVSGSKQDVRNAMKDPKTAPAQSDGVGHDVLARLSEFLNNVLPGLVYLVGIAGTGETLYNRSTDRYPVVQETVGEDEVRHIFNNLLARYVALIAGENQQFDTESGKVTFAKLSLSKYVSVSGGSVDYTFHTPSDPSGEFEKAIGTVKTFHDLQQVEQRIKPPDPGGGSGVSKRLRGVTGNVASLLYTVYSGVSQELSYSPTGKSATLVYSMGLWNLVAGCFENGDFELPDPWEFDQWMGVFGNFVSVMDFSSVRDNLRNKLIPDGSSAKNLDEVNRFDLGQLDSSNRIVGAANFLEPVFSIVDMVNSGIGTLNAVDSGDTSVAVGHSLAFASASASVVLSTLAIFEAVSVSMGSTVSFMVAMAQAGPGGWVIDLALIAVGLMAYALIEFTKDGELVKWLRSTAFGVNFEPDVAEEGPGDGNFRFKGKTVPLGEKREMPPTRLVPNDGKMISQYFSVSRPLGFAKARIKEDPGTSTYSLSLYTTRYLDPWTRLWVYPVVEHDTAGATHTYQVGTDSSPHYLHNFLLLPPGYDRFSDGQNLLGSKVDETYHKFQQNVMPQGVDKAYFSWDGDPNPAGNWSYTDASVAWELYADSVEDLAGVQWDRQTGPGQAEDYLLVVLVDERLRDRVNHLFENTNKSNSEIERDAVMNSPVTRRQRIPIDKGGY